MSLKRTLELSLALANAEFKLRNEGSYLGILWYMAEPVLTFLLLAGVFSKSLGQDIQSYPLYLLVGIIMFKLFQKITTDCTKIIRDNRFIIKSIKFPTEALVNTVILKTLYSHVFEVLFLIGVVLYYGGPTEGLVFYPIVLVPFVIFTAGVSFTLAALTVYFTDVEYIWIFLSRLLWLGTPIFYTIEEHGSIFLLNLLNPNYYFITIARDLAVYNRIPEPWMIAGMIGYSALSIAAGVIIFNRFKPKFSEQI